MSGWVENKGDGASAVRQVEREAGHYASSQFLRLLAARLEVNHLNIDHAVESADLAFRTSDRPDRHATRHNLQRLIGSLDRIEFPIEELAVELPGLRQPGRGDVEPGNAAGSDVYREGLVGLLLGLSGHESQGYGHRQNHISHCCSPLVHMSKAAFRAARFHLLKEWSGTQHPCQVCLGLCRCR